VATWSLSVQVFVVKLAVDAVVGHYLEDVILGLGKADLGGVFALGQCGAG